MGDYLEMALERQRRKEDSEAAAAARAERTARRASNEAPLPPLAETQPAVRRETSTTTSDGKSGSPMSGTLEPPVQTSTVTPLPGSQGAGAGRMDTNYDSSDDEGAHKPQPPPPEKLPPVQPLAPPQMQLGECMGQLGLSQTATTPTTDEQSKVKPRTTRVSDVQPHGRRQSWDTAEEREETRVDRQRQKRERDRQHEAAKRELDATAAILASVLANPAASVFDILMAEFALDRENYSDDAGVMPTLSTSTAQIWEPRASPLSWSSGLSNGVLCADAHLIRACLLLCDTI